MVNNRFQSDRPSSVFMEITPTLATEMLATSVYNRPMSRYDIMKLSGAMTRGEWQVNSDHVAFNIRGELQNGHHRLRAVILSGRTVPMMVDFGMPCEAYEITDIGRRRSYADRLREPKDVSETLRLAASIVYNFPQPSIGQIKTVANAGLKALVQEVLAFCNNRRGSFGSSQMKLAACVLMMQGSDKSYVLQQYRALCTQDYAAMSPIAQSFCRQIVLAREKAVGHLNERVMLARACKVFDVTKANYTRLQIHDGEPESCREMVRQVLIAAINQHDRIIA